MENIDDMLTLGAIDESNDTESNLVIDDVFCCYDCDGNIVAEWD